MDMSTFFFGFVSGVVALSLLSVLVLFWWMRPYLKDARNRLKKEKQTEQEQLRHLWEKHSMESALGANDLAHVWKFSPKRRKR
tara:strand:+ start:189 stop:437 length:249 start_codon:yes stop_codon:yes gene_type:complete